MKKIFSLLITILLLSSCSIDWNDEKDKRISELEKQVKDDAFKKNIECNNFYEKNKEKLYGNEKDIKEIGMIVVSIGYSYKISSCYIAFSLEDSKTKYKQFLIDDLLKKESILTTIPLINNTKDIENEGKKFYDKIKELKGE